MAHKKMEPYIEKHKISGDTIYYELTEGDYVDHVDEDNITSRWMYDRGYLCCLSKHGLRIAYRGRKMEYGTPHSVQAFLPSEFNPYSTVKSLIDEVEYRIRIGMNVTHRNTADSKRVNHEWQP